MPENKKNSPSTEPVRSNAAAAVCAFAVLAAFAALSLSACGSSEPNLMTYAGSREGPDEFLVVPAKPLETPPKPGDLPPPAPGGTNRADPTPEADAVAALGGRPQALNQTGYTQSDATLVAYAAGEPRP